MGASSNIKEDPFFDDDKEKVNTRKIKITDAIEVTDSAKKKTVVKKKKKKTSRVRGQDTNMLSVGNNANDGNDSWDSSRGQAQHVDLSAQVPVDNGGLDGSINAR